MTQAIFSAIALILILLGLVFLCLLLLRCLNTVEDSKDIYTLILPGEEESSLPDKVYFAYLCSLCYPAAERPEMIIPKKNLSPYIKDQCKAIVAPFGNVRFIDTEEITELFK